MYLVTGGAGFIGSNVVHMLDQRDPGHVAISDRMRDGDKWRNIAKREIMDIVDPDAVIDWLDLHADHLKAIVHMGAISATTERDVDKIVHNNLYLSQALWEWCAAHQVPFIYASSAATYGDGTEGFVDDFSLDAMSKLRPLNAYGWSKLAFDKWIARRLEDGYVAPPQWVGLKFFNVYGPNEDHKGRMKSVVRHAFDAARQGKPVRLFKSHHPDYEDGGQMRDFVYVKDCVSVIEWALDNPDVSGVFNLGTGEARTFMDLMLALFGAVHQASAFEWADTPEDIRAKYQYYTQADMTKLRAAGYDKPFHSVEDGVKDYVQTYLMNADDPYI